MSNHIFTLSECSCLSYHAIFSLMIADQCVRACWNHILEC